MGAEGHFSFGMHYIIIGTDHILQKSECPKTGLKDMLQSILRSNRVALIAEEVKTSEDVRTFGRDLVGDEKWLSIDMCPQQKKDAGIYDVLNSSQPECDPVTGSHIKVNAYHQKSEAIRENFWLDRIAAWCEQHHISSGTIVLTCGDNHAHFVAEKVTQRDHTATVKRYLLCDKEEEFGPLWLYPD